MKPLRTWGVLLLFLLSLSACTILPTPTPIPPTATPTPPTSTPLPTTTPMPPTATPIPPTETADLKLAEEPIHSNEGGFSIRYPEGWAYRDIGGSFVIYESEASLGGDTLYTPPMIMIEGGRLPDFYYGVFAEAENAHEMAEALIARVTEGGDVEVISEIQGITLDESPGARIEIAGKLNGIPIVGWGITVHLGERGVVILAVGETNAWPPFAPTLEAMLDSITFSPTD